MVIESFATASDPDFNAAAIASKAVRPGRTNPTSRRRAQCRFGVTIASLASPTGMKSPNHHPPGGDFSDISIAGNARHPNPLLTHDSIMPPYKL